MYLVHLGLVLRMLYSDDAVAFGCSSRWPVPASGNASGNHVPVAANNWTALLATGITATVV
jgi:hypothetical protein